MESMHRAGAWGPRSWLLLFGFGASAAGCPSLAGFSGTDAGEDDRPIGDAGRDRGTGQEAATPSGIRCMDDQSPSLEGNVYCAPSKQECCALQPNDMATLSCVKIGGCAGDNQTEILCDRPSQCDAGPCRICLDQGYLSGTSCDPGEIRDGDGCSDLEGKSEGGFLAGILCEPDGGDDYCKAQGAGMCQPVTPTPTGFVSGWFFMCGGGPE
jgi:hypothetical protein